MNVSKTLKTRDTKIRLLYNDNEGATLNGTIREPEVFYIDSFENKSGIRGRGLRLLCYVIGDIMAKHPDINFIQLNSAPESQEPFGSEALAVQQRRLDAYYESLGFVSVDDELHEYIGDIRILYEQACQQ